MSSSGGKQYQGYNPIATMDNASTNAASEESGSSGIVSTHSSQQLMPSENHSTENMLPAASSRRSSISRKEWFTVIVLCFVNLINYMDRFTIAGVLTDIQIDFNIGDDDGGLLQTAFVLSYMIFAPLFGYLGDRYSRRWIMAVGVLLWSTTTILGSFMNHFGWFITFRALVGIGEASYSTIAPTLISDLFVHDMRSKMLAMFYFAIPVGSGFGYIVGSETARFAGSWRWALRVTPFLGIVAVVLLFLIKDPERGESEGSHNLKTTTYTEDIKDLVKNRSFMLSTGGFTCVAFVAGALAWWGPKFIYLGLRMQPGNEELTQNDVSYKFGIVAMIAGLIGVPLGSFLAQRLRPKIPNCDPYICAFGLLVSSPMVYMALVMPRTSGFLCYSFVFFAQVTLNLTWSIVADILLVRRAMKQSLGEKRMTNDLNYVQTVAFKFGAITMVAGIIGVPMGAFLSQALTKRIPTADPLICAFGLLLSMPLMAAAMIIVSSNTIGAYTLVFFGQLALNLNWAIVADILLYVVVPTRRSTAEAFQILISHALGDAGSPYLVGVISEAIKKLLRTPRHSATALVNQGLESLSLTWENITTTTESTTVADVLPLPVDQDTNLTKFEALQYALFSTSFVEVVGGVFFLLTAAFILNDKKKASQAVRESHLAVPTERPVDIEEIS